MATQNHQSLFQVKNSIAHWPLSERPRETLLQKGPQALTDAALIAILLRAGCPGQDAVSLARQLLENFGGLSGLLNTSPTQLDNVKGLGPAKIAMLRATMELAKRYASESLLQKKTIHSAEEIWEMLQLEMKGLKKEVFKVIFLNQAHQILAIEDLFFGCLSENTIYPRQVIERALTNHASALIFIHNHPAGNLEPSPEDLDTTIRLIEACEIFDLKVLDHLIIGPNNYTSLLHYSKQNNPAIYSKSSSRPFSPKAKRKKSKSF